MQFNTEQQEAILHQKGPALVLAGPGSGKTALLLGRIEALITLHQIPPSQIIVLSFSRAAAREIEERFLKHNRVRQAVYFGTIHAFFYGILKAIRPDVHQQIITSKKKKALLAEAAASVMGEAPAASVLLLLESFMRKSEKEVEEQMLSAVLPGAEDIFRIRTEYEKLKQSEGLLDFDDILRYSEELLKEEPVLRFWQKQYPYVLVDEFQDVSDIQYRLLHMLCGEKGNIFAVGDDDQTIYGFRGASAAGMLSFQKDYPDAALYRLRINYRSTPQILSSASSLIWQNKKRFSKELCSISDNGPLPLLRRCRDFIQECEMMSEEINHLIRQGVQPHRIAVLGRTRERLRRIGMIFFQNDIPFVIPEGIQEDHLGITEDIFAFLRIAAHGRSREDYLRIINKPARQIQRRAFISDTVDPQALLAFHHGNKAAYRSVLTLVWQMNELESLKPFAAVEYIRHEMGYENYWRNKAEDNNAVLEEALRIMDMLQEEASSFADVLTWEEARKKMKSRHISEYDAAGKVRLLTMHGAKGLEFDAVFLPGLCEEEIPGKRSRNEEETEEERRLLYVAMTRARMHLFLSFSREETGHRKRPCRFLSEIQGLRKEDMTESGLGGGH